MSVEYYELYEVQGEFVTADLMVWRRYRRRTPGIVEQMLDSNSHLSHVHRQGPFIPVGTLVRMPIDPTLIRGGQTGMAEEQLWTDRRGYRL